MGLRPEACTSVDEGDHGQSVPICFDDGHGWLTPIVQLNAVISFLATISRTAIMLCISTVLSQGKWLWFKKERSLMDLQNIENASRGPLGSILMLFKFRGG
jgi:Protein of unknown function (DUF3176)